MLENERTANIRESEVRPIADPQGLQLAKSRRRDSLAVDFASAFRTPPFDTLQVNAPGAGRALWS